MKLQKLAFLWTVKEDRKIQKKELCTKVKEKERRTKNNKNNNQEKGKERRT
jgi:hypothetical protein